MEKPRLRPYMEDRIFEISYSRGMVSRVTSYFPLSKSELQEILVVTGSKPEMRSIFTDSISDEEWERGRTRIKKRFSDELIGIGPDGRH